MKRRELGTDEEAEILAQVVLASQPTFLIAMAGSSGQTSAGIRTTSRAC